MGLFMVGLGSVWGKFQSLGIFQGLLKAVLVFWGLVLGLFNRVGLGRISIMHRGVYLGLRSKKQKTAEKQNSGEAEKQRSRKAKKQRSREAGKRRKAKSREAEKQRRRET